MSSETSRRIRTVLAELDILIEECPRGWIRVAIIENRRRLEGIHTALLTAEAETEPPPSTVPAGRP